jgi:hypothetical protein
MFIYNFAEPIYYLRKNQTLACKYCISRLRLGLIELRSTPLYIILVSVAPPLILALASPLATLMPDESSRKVFACLSREERALNRIRWFAGWLAV